MTDPHSTHDILEITPQTATEVELLRVARECTALNVSLQQQLQEVVSCLPADRDPARSVGQQIGQLLDLLDDPGTLAVAQERRRQQEQEGYTAAHDAGTPAGELEAAAACYALAAVIAETYPPHLQQLLATTNRPVERQVYRDALEDPIRGYFGGTSDGGVVPPSMPGLSWPWDASYWKPSADPERNRVRAAALLAAASSRAVAGNGAPARSGGPVDAMSPLTLSP